MSAHAHKNLNCQNWYFYACDALLFQSENFCSSSLCMYGICYWIELSFTSSLSLFSFEKPIDKSSQHPTIPSPRMVVQELNFCRELDRCVIADGKLTPAMWHLPQLSYFYIQHQLINIFCCASSLCSMCGRQLHAGYDWICPPSPANSN